MKYGEVGVILLAGLIATSCGPARSSSDARAGNARYLASERPIDIGLGSTGVCVAVDPSNHQGIWWWEPGASGCATRSTGPGVFTGDRGSVTPGDGGVLIVSFRVPTHSPQEPYRDVHLLLEGESIRMAGAQVRIPLHRRPDLNLPEQPPRG